MSGRSPYRVIVAGGGIAGSEALLALRELAGDRVSVTLIEPATELVLKALGPGAAFGGGAVGRVPIAEIAAAARADVVPSTLARVDPEERTVTTGAGDRIAYDALLVAVGSRPAPSLPEGLIWWPDGDHGPILELLADAEAGRVRALAFVVPSHCAWPLPLYELALVTARRLETRGRRADLGLITPEAAPLAIFGAAGAVAVARELDDAGVAFFCGVVPTVHVDGGTVVTMWPTSRAFEADGVVTLPHAFGPNVAGLRGDLEGFLVTDVHCAVRGTPGVWAAGEATHSRPMHGGLAARQADCAAQSIARLAGARVAAGWLAPVLRAQLRTGRGSLWLARDVSDPLDAGTADRVPFGIPSGKIDALRLGAFLAAHDVPGGLRLRDVV
jgi:sulfide:quinone oxidoreductase